MPTAFITGIEGQDGSYLAELLLAKDYHVVGSLRPRADDGNLAAVARRVELHHRDLAAPDALARLIADVAPDELYHLAAPSFVATGPADERKQVATIVLATQALLAAVAGALPRCRVFLAGSSGMFGDVDTAPQTEATPFRPRSSYGLAKLCAHQMLDYYRRRYGVFACTGLLYNHESPRRGERFVTAKIARAAAAIARGFERELRLGDLTAARDWGYAPDYVAAIWAMLQNEAPEDFVIATGETHTVGDFAARAFARVGLDADDFVVVDPDLVRPPAPVPLVGDAQAIRARLGWHPAMTFESMVDEMVDAEVARLAAVVEQNG